MSGTAEDTTPTAPQYPLQYTVKKRFDKEGRWPEIEPFRDQFMRDCRKQGMSKAEAQHWTYTELDRLYPPLVEPPEEVEDESGEGEGEIAEGDAEQGDISSTAVDAETAEDEQSTEIPAHTREAGLTGLGDIPEDWPTLPANASLAAEIQWCQANRLRVTTGGGESATVDLSQALSPAPSHAAIGWLETSIRAYAKYCDIAAKATQNQEDEREHVRRERRATEEIRDLLSGMVDVQ